MASEAIVKELQPVILETARLYLRELTPDTYRHLFTSCSDADIVTYLGLKTAEELQMESSRYRKGLESYFVTFKTFQLILKATNEIIGYCTYHTWVKSHRRAEIGYNMKNEVYRNKGLMTEALGPALAFGFEHMNLHRIEALTAPANKPSQRLLRHFGFTREGLLREHYLTNGVQEDSVFFSLLKHEYEKLKASWQIKI